MWALKYGPFVEAGVFEAFRAQAAVHGREGRDEELHPEGRVADPLVVGAVLGQPLLDELGLLDGVVEVAVNARLFAVDGQAGEQVAAHPVPAMVVLRVLLPIADVGMGQLLELVKAVIVYPVRGQPEPLADDLPLRVGQQVIGGIVDQRHGGHQVAGAHAVVLFAADFPVLALADGHHQVNGVAGIDRVAGLGVEQDRGHAVPPADPLPAVALVPRLAGGRDGSGAQP